MPQTERIATGPAVIAFAVLALSFALTMLVLTPWNAADRLVPDPVPGGPSAAASPVPADPARDFSASERAREDAFHRDVRPVSYAALAVSLLLALVLGLTPLGARVVELVARPMGGGWLWRVLAGGLVLLVLQRLATLAFSARIEHVRRSAGLSTRTWASWAQDSAKSFAVSAAVTLGVLLVAFALIRTMPRWWFLPAAAAAAAFVFVASFAYPLVVEPLFNRFTPLPDGELRTSLVELADREGVPVRDVLVADASRRTTTLNAYVSGLGSTRRLVVYDTLVERAEPREIRSVVAHELGHAKEGDVLTGTTIGSLGVALGVVTLALALGWPALLRRSGVESPADPRALAFALAVIAVLTTVSGPVENLVSRRIETRADVHALNFTEDPEAFARLQRSLATASLSDLDPPPLVFGLFASHPTSPMRIAFARTWAAGHGVPEPPDLAP